MNVRGAKVFMGRFFKTEEEAWKYFDNLCEKNARSHSIIEDNGKFYIVSNEQLELLNKDYEENS